MCASPFDFLRSPPPPPRVALLPDSLFFARAVAVAPESGPIEVAAQVDLALEELAPFPLAQLYRGHYWVPGSERALVFAVYRRRFTAEQTAAWKDAELVLPTFAAILALKVEPATSAVLASPAGLTLVHWDGGAVPDQVLFRPLPPEATEEDRARLRDELLRAAGGSQAVIDLAEPPGPEPARNDREVGFRCGPLVATLPAATAAALDVRDPEDLAAWRRARARDVVFWRVAAACVVAFAVLAGGEFGLFGAKLWQKTRLAQLEVQKPTVDKIETAQSLANRIDDLSTKRLLPLEMISILSAKKPASIQFLRAATVQLYTLSVEAQTNNAGEIQGYESALQDLPACDKIEVRDLRTRDNVASFTLLVTFRPEELKPAAPPASS